jgi:Na+/H+ antiporter NhaD/arsenite permease-like protein
LELGGSRRSDQILGIFMILEFITSSHIQTIIAILIFITTFVFITFERINRTIISLICAALMVLLIGLNDTDFLNIEAIAHFVDWETIALLIGMMTIVNIAVESGIFSFLAIKAAKLSHGKPISLLVSFSIVTAIGSAFLDNVTTVLLMVPITLSVTRILKLNPVPFFLTEIFFSNIGGAATQIGDPPNIMIGSANPQLSFLDFIFNLAPLALIVGALTMAFVIFVYRKDLVFDNSEVETMMHIDAKAYIKDHDEAKKALIVLGFVILLFFTHTIFHISAGLVAMSGATVLLLLTKNNETKLEHILGKVEWTTIFLLIGLFVQVGGLQIVGIIDRIADALFGMVGGNQAAASAIIIWFSSLFSGFSGNLPSATVMIPVLEKYIHLANIAPHSLAASALWWSLSLGACLGGIATLLGCPANIVVVSMAKKEGYNISYFSYFKFGFPIAIVSTLIAQVYILLRYFVF